MNLPASVLAPTLTAPVRSITSNSLIEHQF